MSRNEKVYKGFVIIAHPQLLVDYGQWSLFFSIEKHTGSRVTNRQFSFKEKYETEEEAIKHCFNAGMQVIDGKVEGCTVHDM